jgi:hypothetical protein
MTRCTGWPGNRRQLRVLENTAPTNHARHLIAMLGACHARRQHTTYRGQAPAATQCDGEGTRLRALTHRVRGRVGSVMDNRVSTTGPDACQITVPSGGAGTGEPWRRDSSRAPARTRGLPTPRSRLWQMWPVTTGEPWRRDSSRARARTRGLVPTPARFADRSGPGRGGLGACSRDKPEVTGLIPQGSSSTPGTLTARVGGEMAARDRLDRRWKLMGDRWGNTRLIPRVPAVLEPTIHPTRPLGPGRYAPSGIRTLRRLPC